MEAFATIEYACTVIPSVSNKPLVTWVASLEISFAMDRCATVSRYD